MVQFIFRRDEIVAEETDDKIIRLIRGYDLVASDAENAKTYYHYASDELGSITHVVDGREVLNHYEYDAWGNLAVCEETVENRFTFNGQQYDPITQQYYLRARYYNPVIARFTQEDTYHGDGLNLYAYCWNNPVSYADPNGHYAQCQKEAYKQKKKELLERYKAEGMSPEEAFDYSKDVYAENHANSNPTLDVQLPNDRLATREQWNEAYRDARLENKPVSDLLRQIHDIEQRTGMRLSDEQMAMLMRDQNVYLKLPTQEQRDTHRDNFNSKKPELIREWEKQTGLQWPTYDQPVVSKRTGRVYLGEGDNYEAHEIHPNAYGGPIVW